MPRVYLVGPMTGIKDNNYPAFNAAAKRLRELGFIVENPAENTPPPCGTWEGWMRLSITQLLTCKAIILINGWSESTGSVLEYDIAHRLMIHLERYEHVIHRPAEFMTKLVSK